MNEIFYFQLLFWNTPMLKGILQCFCIPVEIDFEHPVDVVFGYQGYLHDVAWFVQTPCNRDTRSNIITKATKKVASDFRFAIKFVLRQF